MAVSRHGKGSTKKKAKKKSKTSRVGKAKRPAHKKAAHKAPKKRKSSKRVAAGKRLFAAQAKKHGGVAAYKAILRKRLAKARKARKSK